VPDEFDTDTTVPLAVESFWALRPVVVAGASTGTSLGVVVVVVGVVVMVVVVVVVDGVVVAGDEVVVEGVVVLVDVGACEVVDALGVVVGEGVVELTAAVEVVVVALGACATSAERAAGAEAAVVPLVGPDTHAMSLRMMSSVELLMRYPVYSGVT
jgi:hypothetical protein